jgi:glycosyltransferase involved in cell wall biosynthesis
MKSSPQAAQATVPDALVTRESSAGQLIDASGAERVSVIIPAYNVAPYIAETLKSVFGQTKSAFEVVVVNDGSPDTTELEEVLRPFRDRIVYLKQENRGLSGARNTGIRVATGDLIALLDGDDVWMPQYLETQTRRRHDFFEATPSTIWCTATRGSSATRTKTGSSWRSVRREAR